VIVLVCVVFLFALRGLRAYLVGGLGELLVKMCFWPGQACLKNVRLIGDLCMKILIGEKNISIAVFLFLLLFKF
jgi:hypothetical protein